MALATLCPHCGTLFRVASDQLKLRGGIVRCGACHEIFDGSAALVDLEAPPGTAVADAPPASTPVNTAAAPASALAAALPAPATRAADFDQQPVYTLDFGHTFDRFGILPQDDNAAALQFDAEAKTETETEAEAEAEAEATPRISDTAVSRATAGATDSASDSAGDVDRAGVASTDWSQVWKRPAPPAETASDLAAVPAAAADGRIEPSLSLTPEAEATSAAAFDAAPTPDTEPGPQPAALLKRASAAGLASAAAALADEPAPSALSAVGKRSDRAGARRSKLTPTKIAAQAKLRAADIDEPEFVRRGRQQEQSGRQRTALLSVGVLVLLLVLLAQAAYIFRNTLAAHVPSAKPALAAGCALLGCQVALPAQIDELVIDTGELTTLGGGAYAFTTQLRNGAGISQAWPRLELALLDANDKPLVRRVFAPTDYLAVGTPLGSNSGIAPHGEQAIKLHFRVDDLKPSGYDIAVFYP